jgi:hypothetical protein
VWSWIAKITLFAEKMKFEGQTCGRNRGRLEMALASAFAASFSPFS